MPPVDPVMIDPEGIWTGSLLPHSHGMKRPNVSPSSPGICSIHSSLPQAQSCLVRPFSRSATASPRSILQQLDWKTPLTRRSLPSHSRSVTRAALSRGGSIVVWATLAARGESSAAFDRRCIPAGCVASLSNTTGILPRRALSAERHASLGATLDFHHGLLDGGGPILPEPSSWSNLTRARRCSCCISDASAVPSPHGIYLANISLLDGEPTSHGIQRLSWPRQLMCDVSPTAS